MQAAVFPLAGRDGSGGGDGFGVVPRASVPDHHVEVRGRGSAHLCRERCSDESRGLLQRERERESRERESNRLYIYGQICKISLCFLGRNELHGEH